MDLPQLGLLWSAVALCCGLAQDLSVGICDTNSPEYIEGDGLFEVHTFDAEEGILLEDKRIVGTIVLIGNLTNSRTFDEPYFKKPHNLKTKAQPRRFDVVFLNVSSPENVTTHAPRIPRHVTHTTSALSYHATPTGSLSDLPGRTVTSQGYFVNTSTATTVGSTLPTIQTHPTNATPTSTIGPPVECVVAQIIQIYDLDREESDTHFLTISNNEDELGLPVVARIKVKDINDNTPMFVKESLSSRITKEVKIGEIVGEIKATDADIGLNAELQYRILDYTERRGNETESPDMPTFIIHEKYGIVALFTSIDDLEPPTQITFTVVVKDRGKEYVSNRATATATISIIDEGYAPVEPSSDSLSGGVIAGCVMGGVLVFGVLVFVGFRCTRNRIRRRDAQLEFMLDDENLVSA